jgi:hypothetical protein
VCGRFLQGKACRRVPCPWSHRTRAELAAEERGVAARGEPGAGGGRGGDGSDVER